MIDKSLIIELLSDSSCHCGPRAAICSIVNLLMICDERIAGQARNDTYDGALE